MSENNSYRVEPAFAQLKTLEDLWHSGHAANAIPTYGLVLTWVVTFFGGQQFFMSTFSLNRATGWVYILSFIAGVLACILLSRSVRLIKCQMYLPVLNRQIQEANEAKAAQATLEANNNLNAIQREREKLQPDFQAANTAIAQAEIEYKKNAYAAFLDSLEKSVWQLQTVNSNISSLTKSLQNYRRSLEDSKHNFPSMPVQQLDLPDITQVILELQKVSRLGRTNEACSAALEQRWFNKALFAGFQTIPEAVEHCRTSLIESMNALKREMNAGGFK